MAKLTTKQKIFEVLKDGKWHENIEIQRKSKAMALHSHIDRLRENGHTIISKREDKRGKQCWFYRLVKEQKK